jgi:hypothetical protein
VISGWLTVLPAIGNGLEVGRKPLEQPHHFEIAASLAFQTPARMHAIEVAADVELQVHRRVIRRPSSLGGIDANEAQLLEIEVVDKRIDETNRIALVDPVIEAFRQQRRLSSIRTLDEVPHRIPRRFSKGIISLLMQPGTFHTTRVTIHRCRASPSADGLPLRSCRSRNA